MKQIYNQIIDKLLDLNPDPIPMLILLKKFKDIDPNSIEYQNAYDKVLSHPRVTKVLKDQNEKGFWEPFHGNSEAAIRSLLMYGLEENHESLLKVRNHILRLLHGEEDYDRYEKQDNIRWWPEIFMPLALAGMLSLLDNANVNLDEHRKRWASFADIALSGNISGIKTESRTSKGFTNFFSGFGYEKGAYNYEADKKAQNAYFGFKTTRIIPPFNYYNFLLLPPGNGRSFLSDSTDRALVDYCINEADGIYYVYNKNPGEKVPINMRNRDSRDFCHWIRALSLISQFKGWAKYEQEYFGWIMEQRNYDGLWEFPKKYDLFALSDSWRGKNRAIDSTIYVLRLLLKKKAF